MPSDGKCNSGSGGNNKWGTAIKTSDIVDWHWHSGDVAAKVHLAANLPMFANATLSGGVGGHTSCCIRFMGCQIWRINDLRIWQWIYAHREPTAASKLAINIGFSNFLLPALNPYWITNRNNRLELFGFSFFRSYFHLCLLHLKCNYLRHASVKCRSTDCTNELKPELLQRGVAVFPCRLTTILARVLDPEAFVHCKQPNGRKQPKRRMQKKIKCLFIVGESAGGEGAGCAGCLSVRGRVELERIFSWRAVDFIDSTLDFGAPSFGFAGGADEQLNEEA